MLILVLVALLGGCVTSRVPYTPPDMPFAAAAEHMSEPQKERVIQKAKTTIEQRIREDEPLSNAHWGGSTLYLDRRFTVIPFISSTWRPVAYDLSRGVVWGARKRTTWSGLVDIFVSLRYGTGEARALNSHKAKFKVPESKFPEVRDALEVLGVRHESQD